MFVVESASALLSHSHVLRLEPNQLGSNCGVCGASLTPDSACSMPRVQGLRGGEMQAYMILVFSRSFATPGQTKSLILQFGGLYETMLECGGFCARVKPCAHLATELRLVSHRISGFRFAGDRTHTHPRPQPTPPRPCRPRSKHCTWGILAENKKCAVRKGAHHGG